MGGGGRKEGEEKKKRKKKLGRVMMRRCCGGLGVICTVFERENLATCCRYNTLFANLPAFFLELWLRGLGIAGSAGLAAPL